MPAILARENDVAVFIENPLEDLLRNEVEASPLGQRLGLILPEKIARTVGCCRRTLDREIERGRISATRIAGRTYVSLDAVLAWWEQSQTRPCRTTDGALDSISHKPMKSRTQRGTARPAARTLPAKTAVR